jgi:hypothetical protein
MTQHIKAVERAAFPQQTKTVKPPHLAETDLQYIQNCWDTRAVKQLKSIRT